MENDNTYHMELGILIHTGPVMGETRWYMDTITKKWESLQGELCAPENKKIVPI